MISNHILSQVGRTPVAQLEADWLRNIRLFAKLEFYNPTGIVKDMAACYIIDKLLKSGEIDKQTTIIESTSGNLGISLAAYSKMNGLRSKSDAVIMFNPMGMTVFDIALGRYYIDEARKGSIGKSL